MNNYYNNIFKCALKYIWENKINIMVGMCY